MSEAGAKLQGYNNELVTCLQGLLKKREMLQKQIEEEEDERSQLQKEIKVLTEQLESVQESLANKISVRNEYDKTINDTQAMYMKIIESSHNLLSVVKTGARTLEKKLSHSDVHEDSNKSKSTETALDSKPS